MLINNQTMMVTTATTTTTTTTKMLDGSGRVMTLIGSNIGCASTGIKLVSNSSSKKFNRINTILIIGSTTRYRHSIIIIVVILVCLSNLLQDDVQFLVAE